MAEKITTKELNTTDLEGAVETGRQILAEVERNIDKKAESERAGANEKSRDDAKHEALETASSTKENEQRAKDRSTEKAPKEREQPVTKDVVNARYQATLGDMRSQLSAPSKAFSKVIHNPVVEKTSEVIGSTIARPNLIIAGALGAIASIIVYLIASQYGYALSGFETIGLFIFGWAIGAIFEFARVGFLNKRS